jgi:hypothetical protein
MSSTSVRHVLAIVYDGEPEARDVVDRAVQAADAERARLTLAKTSDPGRLVRWCAPLAALGRCAPVLMPDPRSMASRALAHVADRVPASIPLGLVVLAPDTACSTRKLLGRGDYDLVVVSGRELRRDLRLRRVLRRAAVSVVPVREGTSPLRPDPGPDPAAAEPRLATVSVDRVAPA